MQKLSCPLCHCADTEFYHQDTRREYFQCTHCYLVFVHPDLLPTLTREKQEYDLHENHAADEGYRQFLSRARDPVVNSMKKGARGLDFGCGPAPVLADMLTNNGFIMDVFDPIYAPSEPVLYRRHYYDFITCTEAIEHFHQPVKELKLFSSLLKENGLLVVMTKRVESKSRFTNWHYKNDLTHVSFFSDATFYYIGDRMGFNVSFRGKDVVLLKKRP
ncbi:class I SAM-dependent methyltransferase [Aestuariibacter sp. A3R04]|uniref:class I SAM-dependent methyltransferase n=1 Tax=Aestuariibacter sp. A3R04 TaxID=2841571 RepID=UPI001C0A04C7|nr:methyltransferase domain-containing protein [Aestuariibacter sp. A3R04]MBU3020200.1 methyltransferase domain-containing protein [Aestuariibacter sp. A3R04]